MRCPELGDGPGLKTCTEVRKNDPKFPGSDPTTGMNPTTISDGRGVAVAVSAAAGVAVFVRVRVAVLDGVNVRVTVGLADALGVSVGGRVNTNVGVTVAVVVTVAVAVVVGVEVGVCASAAHNPTAAKRKRPATAIFGQARLSAYANPSAPIMDPSGGPNTPEGGVRT
jgi:hypothetical protein